MKLPLPKGWSLGPRETVLNVGVWNPKRRRYTSRKVSGYTLKDETGYVRFIEGPEANAKERITLILSNHGY